MDGKTPKFKIQQSVHNQMKRASPSVFGQPKNKVPRKRGRTKQDFLDFCAAVLKYADYNPDTDEDAKVDKKIDYNMNSRTSGETAHDSLGSGSDSGSAQHDDGSSTATAASSTSSSGSSDEDEIITCFCRKPYANRPMIQCGSCETWIHLSCAKIRRNHIPDVYICSKCRDASQAARKSSRPRVENKKFVEEH